MNRRSSPYLLCRYGTYFVRVRVPSGLIERVGVIEVRRSLGSSSFSKSRLLALRYGSRLKEQFEMMMANDMTKEECLATIRKCFRGLAGDADQAFVPTSEDPAAEVGEQAEMAKGHIAYLRDQISSGVFDQGTASRAETVLAEYGVDMATAPLSRRHELIAGIARAVVEQQSLYLYRLGEPLAPYQPVDPLFSNVAVEEPAGVVFHAEPEIGLTMGELRQEYLKARAKEWTPKTRKTHEQKLKLLEDHLGTDRRASSVTVQDIWAFRDGLLRLRRNYHVGVSRTFQSHQTTADEGTIAAVTATNILARTKSLFRWAFRRGLIASNPAEIVTVTPPKQKKGSRSRRPFSTDELATLFSSPLFTGCASSGRRFCPGDEHVRDAYFWVPILAYYTGARLGEIIQLRFNDVIVEDDVIPHISINEDDQGGSEPKHVKSDAGVRCIPLHRDILALGFASFVRQRRAIRGKRNRLFWEIKYGADGQASTVFSKWFRRARHKVGLSAQAICFHSFRHTMEDIYRNSQVPKYVIDKLMGHRDPSAAGQYGAGVDLATAYEVVANLKFPLSVPTLVEGG